VTHEAPHRRRLLDSLPFRAFVLGTSIDVLVALCMVVLTATTSDHVDWRLLGLLVAKTLVHTLASSILRRVRPPET
jgi:hypothetical protein